MVSYRGALGLCTKRRRKRNITLRKRHLLGPNVNTWKHCGRCDGWYPIEDFAKNNQTRDGRAAACKGCIQTTRLDSHPGLLPPSKRVLHHYVDGVELKRCGRCQRWKSLSEFSPDRDRWDGLRNRCRACISDHNRAAAEKKRGGPAYPRNVPHKIERGVEVKLCYKCKQWLPLEKFLKNSQRLDGLMSQCQPCYWSRARKHDVARRARKANADGSHTEKEWQELCAATGFRCLACGEKKPLTRDHMWALVKGGSDFIYNIQPLCRRCNSVKSTKFINYWLVGVI